MPKYFGKLKGKKNRSKTLFLTLGGWVINNSLDLRCNFRQDFLGIDC